MTCACAQMTHTQRVNARLSNQWGNFTLFCLRLRVTPTWQLGCNQAMLQSSWTVGLQEVQIKLCNHADIFQCFLHVCSVPPGVKSVGFGTSGTSLHKARLDGLKQPRLPDWLGRWKVKITHDLMASVHSRHHNVDQTEQRHALNAENVCSRIVAVFLPAEGTWSMLQHPTQIHQPLPNHQLGEFFAQSSG